MEGSETTVHCGQGESGLEPGLQEDLRSRECLISHPRCPWLHQVVHLYYLSLGPLGNLALLFFKKLSEDVYISTGVKDYLIQFNICQILIIYQIIGKQK